MELRRRCRAASVAGVLTLSLAGCSSVPSALNPVEWYNKTADAVGGWFDEESGDKTADSGSYPNLASVPEKPQPKTNAEQRTALQNQLVADRQNARYDDKSTPPRDAAGVSPVTPATPLAEVKPKAPAEAAPAAAPAPAPAAVTAAPAPRAAAPTPVPQPAEAVPVAPQRAAIAQTSRTQSGPRSSLWPNSPPPDSAGDRPQTSARVGDPRPRGDRTTQPIRSMPLPSEQVAQEPARAAAPVRAAEAAPAAPAAPARPAAPAAPSRSMPAPLAEPAPAEQTASLPAAAPAESQPPASAGALRLIPPSAAQQGAAMPQDGSVTFDPGALPGSSYGSARGYGASHQAGVVTFANGSARLSPADRGMLREMARLVRQYGATVTVVGHASSRTRDMDPFQHQLINFEVSAERANAVAEALIQAGVPAERISVQAVGDSQPAASEAMPAGEAENRRAEIFLVY